MGDASLVELSIPQDVLQPLLSASNSSSLEETLENLIEASRTDVGRLGLASKNILPIVLQLSQNLPYPSGRHLLLSSLKLLRNLCAGEVANQDAFVEQNGVGVVSNILSSAGLLSDPDYGTIRMGLQVLANVSLAGEEHQRAIWRKFFPDEFVALARVRSQETCDPLCMVIYACCDGCPGLDAELCGDFGLPIVEEIVRTACVAGFREDWLKLILSKICLEGPHFPPLFLKLCLFGASSNGEDIEFRNDHYSSEHAFLLKIVSEILNERLNDITVPNEFTSCVFGIFKRSVGVTNSVLQCKSGLPTGSTAIDVLGYSLIILRDICAGKRSLGSSKEDESMDAVDMLLSKEDESMDAVDMLLSSGLVEMLLCLLGELEPPTIIRKGLKQGENQDSSSSYSLKPCPYRGFRRDIVAVIGNCAFRRKHVQDEIRQKNGILLLLQQCVTDEDNPFLREWGIWTVRNLLEGSTENQHAVAELELQGSVEMPELTGLGLRVEVDPKTRRTKLVNIS